MMSLSLALPFYTKKPSSFSLCNPQIAFNGGSPTCFPPMKPHITSQIQTVKTTEQVPRRNANFAPTIWGDYFINLQPNSSELEAYSKEVDVLKEEVRNMLMASTRDSNQNIHLIDLLCRLCLEYYYETEIQQQLHQIYYGQDNIFQDNDYNLDTMSRLFRLCRQYGYDISPVVFNKFLNKEGKFKAELEEDAKGMLSLYEASHLSINGEDILDEALAFTTTYLKSLVNKPIKKHLSQHIKNALVHPFHKSFQKEEARKYIDFYENEDCCDDKILKFAKYEFNRVLLIYQQELNYVSSWWKKTNLPSEYPFIRDRIVEIYGWGVGSVYETIHERARIRYAQVIMLLSIIDDFTDSYATPHEIQLFAAAIRRWDIDAIDTLPDYIHSLYRNIMNLWDEINKEMINAGKPYSAPALKNCFIDSCNAYEKEAQWSQKGYVPTLSEYLNVATHTSGLHTVTAATYMGMENADEDACNWIQSASKLIKAAWTHARIANDLVSYMREQRTGQHASSIECYMRQYGISKEEVVNELKKTMTTQWKVINEEFLRPTPIPYNVMLRMVNGARACEAWYLLMKDPYTEPEYCKDLMSLLFVDKILV